MKAFFYPPWIESKYFTSRVWSLAASGTLLVASATYFAGCGVGSLEPGFESSLTRDGGCADIYLYAANTEDTIALLANTLETYAAQSNTEGQTITVTWTLPDDGLNLRVETGQYLTDAVCDDVMEHDVRVEDTYTPIAGQATLTVVPEGEPNTGENSARATLVLSDVVLESTNDPSYTVDLPAFEIADAYVGWFPG